MSTQEQASPRQMRLIGIAATLLGLAAILIGFGLLPVPGGRDNLHGPLWVALVVGLAVLLAGVAALLQGIGQTEAKGDLLPVAPLWLRAGQQLIGAAIFVAFATIGTWVAFAGDPHQFSGGIPFLGRGMNVGIARFAFGFGALICWLGAAAFAVTGVRTVLGRSPAR
jgi:hypothetical protein